MPSARCLVILTWTCLLQSKHEASFICVFSSRSYGMEARCFSASLEWSQYIHVSPVCYFKTGQVESDAFDKSRVDRSYFFLTSKGVVCRSASSFHGRTSRAPLAAESPGPHSSHRSGDIATSCMESFNSLSARLALYKRLQRSSLWISNDSQHASARKSILDFSVGVMEGIYLYARPLFFR